MFWWVLSAQLIIVGLLLQARSSCSEVLDLNPDADKQKIRRRFRKLVVPWWTSEFAVAIQKKPWKYNDSLPGEGL